MASHDIAIIGAGLAGLCLALSLQQKSIKCKVYESRPRGTRFGGAVMLSPNALRVLDHLGVYSRITKRGFHFDQVGMKNDEHVPMGTYLFGSEDMFGYSGFRIYRQELINELVAMAEEIGVHIEFEKKYERVVSEDDLGVLVEFTDGTTIHPSLLIGTDGIHSSVRQLIAKDAAPTYLGLMAVAGAVKTKDVILPSPDYSLPVSIFGKPGVFILAPQDIDGSELMAGTQFQFPEPSREEQKAISKSPEKMLEMVRRDRSLWPTHVQSALDNMIPSSMYTWPFYTVPQLKSWMSPGSKVLIIGDAAHAIPPTMGQGANQAFEEALSLSIVLEKYRNKTGSELTAAMDKWSRHRMERINNLMLMTKKMNNNRLPAAQREELSEDQLWKSDPDRPGEEMRWLYDYDVHKEMSALGF